MKRIMNIAVLALLVLASGCVKDETNRAYSYLDLPYIDNPDKEPFLLVENGQYTLKVGDVLEITPAIVYSDMDDLAYEWVIDGETVSTEKNLVWTCDLTGTRASCAFYMTRVSKGNSVIIRFNIQLDQPYSCGWLIATERDGKVIYDFLQRSTSMPYTYAEYPDALATESTAESWLDCMEFWSNETGANYGHMLTLDSDPAKSFSVEEMTMLKTVSLEQEFIGETFPEDVKFTDALYCGYVAYLQAEDGRLYYRKSQTGYYTGRFSNLPLKYDGEDLKVSAMIGGPYNLGLAVFYDGDNDRFLMVNNGYNDYSNTDAGEIMPFPDGSDFGSFAGEKILHSHIVKPQYTFMGDPFLMFIVSSDGSQCYASQYPLSQYQGYLPAVTADYFKVPVAHFGENSVISVLDDPTNGLGYVYYTDNDNPQNLYCLRRTDSGLSSPVLYGTFDSGIVSIDQGAVTRNTKTIGIALEDGSFLLLDLSDSMDKYVAPDGENANSLAYRWEGRGNILKVDFRYGNSSSYFPA